MSKSRKKQTFSKVAAVKSNARDRVGTPKASFVITPKNKRPSRYTTSWADFLDKEDAFECYTEEELENLQNGNVRIIGSYDE